VAAPGSGLGILSKVEWSAYEKPCCSTRSSRTCAARIEGGDLLIYSKTNRTSTVHRRARMDYIGIRRVSPEGRIVGEARMVGLFTSKAYTEPASKTPLLHRKLQQILDAEDLFEGSHDYKAVVTIFESFPKDELFAASTEELREQVMGLLHLQEAKHIRLFVRRDLYGRSVSLLVAIPRDLFDAEKRHRLQDLFLERFQGTTIDYHLSLTEGGLAQLHFTVHVGHGQVPDVPFDELQREVVEITRSWEDRLLERLVAEHGQDEGRRLFERWADRFPDYYKAAHGGGGRRHRRRAIRGGGLGRGRDPDRARQRDRGGRDPHARPPVQGGRQGRAVGLRPDARIARAPRGGRVAHDAAGRRGRRGAVPARLRRAGSQSRAAGR
jgi:glutamate dehydrogenase